MISDSTQRFSSRVANYVKYRPDYPPSVLGVLRDRCGLTPASAVADVGAGTGIFTRQLLDNGNEVHAVEPNAHMREAAAKFLAGAGKLHLVDGTAEHTALPDGSVDLVVCAQAFHRFDRARTRAEFTRILKPGGWVALVWNDRRLDATPFLREYEALLQRYGTDYLTVRHHDLDLPQVQMFAGHEKVSLDRLENRQALDYDGIRGRLLSSSYAPEVGHPDHEPMLAALREAFDRHQHDGTISLDYDTQVYCFRLSE